MTLIDIATAIKNRIQANVVGDATVDIAFDPVISEPLSLPVDQKMIHVIPMPNGVEFREASNRANDRHVYRVGVVFYERFDGSLKLASRMSEYSEHMQRNIEFVDRHIYTLKDLTFVPIETAYLESVNWRVVYEPEYLREYTIFWSEIDFEYAYDEPNQE